MLLDHVVSISEPSWERPDAGNAPTRGGYPEVAARERAGRETSRAVVGGADHAVEGWGGYEIARRKAEWKENKRVGGSSRPGDRYPGRTYIHGHDAALSILASSRETVGGGASFDSKQARGHGSPGTNKSALSRAATRLADSLRALEDRLCEPDEDGVRECAKYGTKDLVIPAVTSDDLREFADDPEQEADPEALYELDEDVAASVASLGVFLPSLSGISLKSGYPPLPTRAIQVSDDEGILRLEAATGPYVASLERAQAAVATRFDIAATAILAAARSTSVKNPHGFLTHGGARTDSRKPTRPGSAPVSQASYTRGEEIDAAAAECPPLGALEAGLPPKCSAGWHNLDLDVQGGDPPKFVEADYGLYCGASWSSDKSRATALRPSVVAHAARLTSGRIYAWVILESSEATYAVRASPADGHVRVLDPEGIMAWLQPRLTGAPPHKISMGAYLAYLKGLGLEIHAAGKHSAEIRFDLYSVTPQHERIKVIRRLSALTEADFAGMDWSGYDRDAGSGACTSPARETAGDVHIDLDTKTVSATKVRMGVPASAQTHSRSYVTFHTHPSGRFRGNVAEEPSTSDLLSTLQDCANDHGAWHFVSAPEGTYIIRPTAFLKQAYAANASEANRLVEEIYADSRPEGKILGNTLADARDVTRLLTEAGFVAFFRESPCMPLLGIPDAVPWYNSRTRSEIRVDFAAASQLTGSALLGADWSGIMSLFGALSLPAATYRHSGRAELSGESVRIMDAQDGHRFPGDVTDTKSWGNSANWPGPILVVVFVGNLPRRVPQAAVSAARANTDHWAWVAFLSSSEVLVFRATDVDLEVHGPSAWAPAGQNKKSH
jgi:hypothetical protein